MASGASTGRLQIRTKDLVLSARWEDEKAPNSCEAIRKLLPIRHFIIQTRWSGEAAWIPIDHLDLDIQFENHTIYPSKGDLLVYPGFINVKEILVPYGSTAFGSKMGLLPGNHFATVVDGQEHLDELGRRVLMEGAQEIELTEEF